MKSRTLILVAAMTLLIVPAIPLRLAAQEQQQMKQLPRYTVIDLGTLGGAFSDGQSINNKGWVTGTAQLSGNTAQHGFLWQEGVKTDLGSLGGPNSGAGFVGGLNDRGQAVGHAETSTPDPLGEDFCFFGTHLVCLPFLWQDGVMTPLPTLGGNNGAANGVNNQGRVVGWRVDSIDKIQQVAHEELAVPASGDTGPSIRFLKGLTPDRLRVLNTEAIFSHPLFHTGG